MVVGRKPLLAILIGVAALIAACGTSVTQEEPSALPLVRLGEGHVWPETPVDGSPTEVALAFASEVLSWDNATAIKDPEGDPSGPMWISLQHDGAIEPVKVLTSPMTDLGRVLVQVGVPSAMGLIAGAIEPGEPGSAVSLPHINGAVAAHLTLRLSDGKQLVVETAPGDLEAGRVEIPNIEDPREIRTVLIRYFDDHDHVIAAIGGDFS